MGMEADGQTDTCGTGCWTGTHRLPHEPAGCSLELPQEKRGPLRGDTHPHLTFRGLEEALGHTQHSLQVLCRDCGIDLLSLPTTGV